VITNQPSLKVDKMFFNTYSNNDPTAEFNGTFFFLVVGVIGIAVWLCAGGFSQQLPTPAANSGTAYSASPTSSVIGGRGSYFGLGRTLGRAVFRMR
jgi:hypothetical protein